MKLQRVNYGIVRIWKAKLKRSLESRNDEKKKGEERQEEEVEGVSQETVEFLAKKRSSILYFTEYEVKFTNLSKEQVFN